MSYLADIIEPAATLLAVAAILAGCVWAAARWDRWLARHTDTTGAYRRIRRADEYARTADAKRRTQ